MPARIIPVVEGHGDVAAVPVLIRRIAHSLGIYDTQVARPIRSPRHKLTKTGELERIVELAVLKGQGVGRLLILIDAESDCPAELAPDLIARVKQAREEIPAAVVLAKKEFESWFLGSLESLRGRRSISITATSLPNPEQILGAKEHLATHMEEPYSEVLDQPALASLFDMEEARRRCPSFDKCWRAVESLLATAPDP